MIPVRTLTIASPVLSFSDYTYTGRKSIVEIMIRRHASIMTRRMMILKEYVVRRKREQVEKMHLLFILYRIELSRCEQTTTTFSVLSKL
jgi:hypothetical protein